MEIKVSEEIKEHFIKLKELSAELLEKGEAFKVLIATVRANREAIWKTVYERYPEVTDDKEWQFDVEKCAIVGGEKTQDKPEAIAQEATAQEAITPEVIKE